MASKFPDCWVFDQNRRVYPKGERGGGPIWREHWRRVEIVGETSRSWVTECGRKVSKKGGSGISFSQEEIDQQAWIQDNRHKIGDRVERCRDFKVMKAIADLVGYGN